MKKILMLLFLGMFFISSVSAEFWTIDNKVYYDNYDKDVQVKDLFGLGKHYANLKITSHSDLNKPIYVGTGWQRVIVQEIEGKEDYNNFISGVRFKNMKNGKEDNLNYYWEKAIYGDVEVNDYENKCNIIKSVNGSSDYESCEQVLTGTHKETQIVKWEKFEDYNIKKDEKITLALVVNVKKGDYYDGIPKFFGKEIKEWASWSSDYENGLLGYWQFNETSGTKAVEHFNGTYNLTVTGDHWVNGKIGNGYGPEGDEGTNSNIDLSGEDAMTLNFWIKDDGTIAEAVFQAQTGAWDAGTYAVLADGEDAIRFLVSDGSLCQLKPSTIGTDWAMYTLRINNTYARVDFNGDVNITQALSNFNFASKELWVFDAHNGLSKGSGYILDEVGVWNRWLSDSELTDLYNSGSGITPPESAPEISITITNPTATTYTTDTHDLEYTYDEGDGTADSCWYSLNLGETNSSREDCGTNWSSLTASEGSNTWTVYGNTTDGILSNDTVTFSVDTIDPVVNVEYPTGTIDYTSPGTTLELNFTATDTNLDSCWYEYDDSNTTVSCSSGVKVNTNFTLTDQSNLTVWANDSVGRLASNFTSWEANLQVNNLTYTGNVFETSRQTFTAEFEVLDTEISSLQFLYNNETYTITGYTFDGNILTLTKTIDIPLNTNPFSNQTSNFSFKFDYGGGSIQNTEKFYQNVSYINLQNCNTTTTTQALNFTLYDELKQQNINAAQNSTSFESFFSYWIGSGDIKKTYAFQELLNSSDNSYQFCIYPYNQNTTFKVDSDIDYSATYFRENQHHLRNSTLTNVSNDILLYLISNDEATKFFLTFQQGVNFIDDATVTVQKYFTGLGEYKSVAILLTDDDGETTMWQEVDKQYKYSVVQDGSLLGVVERTSICSVAPCTMTIALESASENVFEPYYDVYAIGITSNLSFDKDSKIVTYNFLDTTGLANYFRLVVKEMQMNSTGNTICDSQLYSIAGTLTCNLSAYSNSEFIATTYISRSPELTDKVLGIIISEDIIEGLGLMGIFLIMGIIITIVFAGAVVTKGSPSGVLWFLAIGILVLKLMGLFPFTWITTTALMIIILYIISKVKT